MKKTYVSVNAPVVDFFTALRRGVPGCRDMRHLNGSIILSYSDGKNIYRVELPDEAVSRAHLVSPGNYSLELSDKVTYAGNSYGVAWFTNSGTPIFGFGCEAIATIKNSERVVWENPVLRKRCY